MIELFIYLGEPCHVCQLLLTISHGADDSTYPSTIDVRTGRHLDGLKLVLEVSGAYYLQFSPLNFALVCALQLHFVFGMFDACMYTVDNWMSDFLLTLL